MKDFMLHTAKSSVAVSIESDHIWISNGEMNSNNESYNLSFDHYKKLKSYKSVSALLKYAKAHCLACTTQEAQQVEITNSTAIPVATPSEQAIDVPSDSLACGVAPHSPVQSPNDVNGSLAGEPSPVAVSAPTASDTPFFKPGQTVIPSNTLFLPDNSKLGCCLQFIVYDATNQVTVSANYSRDSVIEVNLYSENPNYSSPLDQRLAIPYSDDVLNSLLTTRNPQRLWAIAQSFVSLSEAV